MDWRELDIDLSPGHYHFKPQAPRLPMRYRRAAVMRGFDTDMGALGVGEMVLTVHDRGKTPIPDDDLPHFDVHDDATAHRRDD